MKGEVKKRLKAQPGQKQKKKTNGHCVSERPVATTWEREEGGDHRQKSCQKI